MHFASTIIPPQFEINPVIDHKSQLGPSLKTAKIRENRRTFRGLGLFLKIFHKNTANITFRPVNLFIVSLNSLKTMEIYTETVNVSKTMVSVSGRTSLEDAPRKRRSKITSKPDIVTKIKDMVLEYRLD